MKKPSFHVSVQKGRGITVIERNQTVDFSLEQLSLLSGVEYSRPDGQPLLMDLIFCMQASRPMPAIIWLHGGGFTEEQMTRLSRPERRFILRIP